MCECLKRNPYFRNWNPSPLASDEEIMCKYYEPGESETRSQRSIYLPLLSLYNTYFECSHYYSPLTNRTSRCPIFVTVYLLLNKINLNTTLFKTGTIFRRRHRGREERNIWDRNVKVTRLSLWKNELRNVTWHSRNSCYWYWWIRKKSKGNYHRRIPDCNRRELFLIKLSM